jgi:hypothetical protein
VPIIALPGSPITVRTSSKSTLTWPGTLMISAMPPTAFFSTSLACAKASSWVMSSPSTSSSFSFSTTISESTLASSSDRPLSALVMRRPPSQSNGLVTTPDGQDAHLLGHARDHRRGAGAGAAAHAGGDEQHVRARDRLADALHGQLRALAALVRLAAGAQAAATQLDVLVRRAAGSACASVLAQMNSTPCTLRSIMCATALPPPPPTPITLICVPWWNSSTSIISMLIAYS